MVFSHANTTGVRLSQRAGGGDLNSLPDSQFVYNIDIIIIIINKYLTYKSPNFIVVQVNQCAGIVSRFQSIHKELGNPLPKLHVVAASSPDPAPATCKTDAR